MCPSLGTQVFHCLEVPIKLAQVHSIVYFPQFVLCNLHRIMSYTPYKFSHYWHLNQTHQKGGFSWREFQDEQVPSSTLVLNKAPICIDDTLSPAQNRENTPPGMGFNLMQYCSASTKRTLRCRLGDQIQWEKEIFLLECGLNLCQSTKPRGRSRTRQEDDHILANAGQGLV